MRAKAIFLLVIFMLNSIAGFSCALHMANGCDTDGHTHMTSHFDRHTNGNIHDLNIVKEDLCCKGLMGTHIIQGKLIPETNKVLIQLPAIWVERYAGNSLIFVAHTEINHNEFIDHWFWPPKRDIRIAIQSFQI